MIYIDFQGGAHGNYLEFVCNKFLAGVPSNESPFNTLGASHKKIYYGEEKFLARHFFEDHNEKVKLINSKVISIQIHTDDLLPLSSISLLRAGDGNIDNDKLEIETYHKLNNKNYQWVLNNLISSFFQKQIQDSYNKVKDDDWPDISSLEEFQNLPEWIQHECINQHDLKLRQLDEHHPDCPRYVLREFFKIGFLFPEQSGFMTQQEKIIYDSSNNVFIFPFESFYDTLKFIDQVQSIGEWCQFELQNPSELIKLHDRFLTRQPYKDSKKFCDELLKKIYQKEIFNFPKLDLLQESYVQAQLEKHYACKFPTDHMEWYKSSKEIFGIVK